MHAAVDEDRVAFTPMRQTADDRRLDRLAGLVEKATKTATVALIVSIVAGVIYSTTMLLFLSRIVREVLR